jgi:hypothetical protein
MGASITSIWWAIFGIITRMFKLERLLRNNTAAAVKEHLPPIIGIERTIQQGDWGEIFAALRPFDPQDQLGLLSPCLDQMLGIDREFWQAERGEDSELGLTGNLLARFLVQCNQTAWFFVQINRPALVELDGLEEAVDRYRMTLLRPRGRQSLRLIDEDRPIPTPRMPSLREESDLFRAFQLSEGIGKGGHLVQEREVGSSEIVEEWREEIAVAREMAIGATLFHATDRAFALMRLQTDYEHYEAAHLIAQEIPLVAARAAEIIVVEEVSGVNLSDDSEQGHLVRQEKALMQILLYGHFPFGLADGKLLLFHPRIPTSLETEPPCLPPEGPPPEQRGFWD